MINLSKFFKFQISNVYRACSFLMNLDLFCIDNACVMYRKIRYFASTHASCNLHVMKGLVLRMAIYSSNKGTQRLAASSCFNHATCLSVWILSGFLWAVWMNDLHNWLECLGIQTFEVQIPEGLVYMYQNFIYLPTDVLVSCLKKQF